MQEGGKVGCRKAGRWDAGGSDGGMQEGGKAWKIFRVSFPINHFKFYWKTPFIY
jgi:hypothetical protein